MSETYLLKDLPPELRSLLVQESRHRLESLRTFAAGIVAARYEIPYEPQQRKAPKGATYNGDILLSLPAPVMAAVRSEADTREVSLRSVFLTAFSEHFGLEPPASERVDPKKRPGRPKHGRPRGRKGRK